MDSEDKSKDLDVDKLLRSDKAASQKFEDFRGKIVKLETETDSLRKILSAAKLDELRNSLEEFKVEIDRLKESSPPEQQVTFEKLQKFKDELTKFDEDLHRSESQKSMIRAIAEDAILNSAFVKLAKSILIGYLILITAIWIGGTIYGGIQISGIQQQSRETLQEIRRVESEVTEAESVLRRLLAEQTDDVQLASENAIKEVNDESIGAVEEINSLKEEAIRLLDIENLPDLGELKNEINALNQELGKLNARSLSAIIDVSVYILYGLALIPTVLFLILLVWIWRTRRG